MERINSAKFGTLNRSEMGKLVGGTNTTSSSDRGETKDPEGNTVRFSADCVTKNESGVIVGQSTYSYATDSVAGWKSPCQSIAVR